MNRLLFLTLALASACQPTDTGNKRSFTNILTSSAFELGKETGLVQGNFVKELSGIVASRHNPGAYWVQSDGPKSTQIFLIDSLGNLLANCQMPGLIPHDCEDIEIGPGPEKGVTYIYLADTGDNNAVFDSHVIYRFPEPGLPAEAPRPGNISAEKIEKLTFQYPEGKRWNAETLLLDPKTLDLYVVTKAAEGGFLFRFPYPQSTTQTTTLELIADMPIEKATGGDISPDGTEVLVKSKQEIFYWKAKNGENIRDLMQKNNPERVPYEPETQGEAVCFNLNATGFLTSTEKAHAIEQPIYYFARKK